MTSSNLKSDAPGLTISDVYHILFRRKAAILVCSLCGIGAAVALYFLNPPPYSSEAKLFIRYVAETKTPAPGGAMATAKSPDQRGETILDSEMEIITSWDIARQVAQTVGPEVILGHTGMPNALTAAAAEIKANLLVEAPPRSSVIRLVFRHRKPAVAQRVLNEIIACYLRTHVEIHRAVGIVDDFLTQETDQIRTKLTETEKALRESRSKAGVLSLPDARKAYTEQIAAIRQQIFATRAELAERQAVLRELQRLAPAGAAAGSTASVDGIPAASLEQHRNALYRLGVLRRMEQDLLTQYREENTRVQDVRAQIAATEKVRQSLETEFPSLARANAGADLPGAAAMPKTDPEAEAIRVTALESKLATLDTQLDEVRAEAAGLEEVDGSITDLNRKKDLEEANFRYFSASLEQARIDEALGAGRVSNISEIQKPSPPAPDSIGATKLMGLLGGAGIFTGFAWAFFMELYVDRTVKRPADLERILRPSILLSVPDLALPQHVNGSALATTVASDGLAPFVETLRDRIIGYFENHGLDHKPKLIAVTGIDAKAGVSTTAAGLARSLSEIGEGNVLLVDMTIGRESARHFVGGQALCDIDQVLAAREPAMVDANLFVVAENPNRDQLSRRLPRRFARLAPKLKASAFDYIIFDLPAVSPISITPRVAGFMDMLLLVVKSEATGLEVLRHATALLAEAKVPLGVVLNQTRTYVPGWLKQDFALSS